MLDRRQLLLAGAAACAGCAHAPSATPATDAEFRRAVEQAAEVPARTRTAMLARFDPARLTPGGRVLYEGVKHGAEADAALTAFAWGQSGAPYAVTHRNGAYRSAAGMRDAPDIAVQAVEEDTARLESDAARGVIAPDFVIDAAIPAVEAAVRRVRDGGEQRYAPLADALAAQADTLRGLRARAGSEPGVWRLPDGERYYRLVLQLQLGARVDPAEAHARALARCRALQSEADALLRAQGLTHGDVGARLRELARDEARLYADTPEGKAAAVADMAARLARVRALVADMVPGAGDAAAQVQLLPAAQEANGAAGRRQGASYIVDLGNIRARPRWTLPSVVHHELIPGHIVQASFEARAAPLPLQLRYAGGYSEGWATYAEQVADEAGAFADDALGRIGYLQWMLFRMARVVADTGIHALRWSRARAVEEMRALQGESIAFISIEEDVVRFSAQPGLYAAQGLAALHIADLRERTRNAAGGRFEPARFHTAILRHGPLSPPGLEQAVRAELAQRT